VNHTIAEAVCLHINMERAFIAPLEAHIHLPFFYL
jgi:hypothetical protein